MSVLGEHVTVTLTEDSIGIARAGFGVPMFVTYTPTWVERTRVYGGFAEVVSEFGENTFEALLAAAVFAQTPHPEQIMFGRGANKPTQKYQINVSAVTANRRYAIDVVGPGITETTATYVTPLADLTITLVTNASDTFTSVSHKLTTGDGPYRYSAGTTVPTGLAVDTNYWVIRLTDDTFQLANSLANALATTPINITSDGVGAQTLRRVQNDVICAQLVQALNAVVGANYVAAQIVGSGETDYVEVTASAAGNWFSLEVLDLTALTIKQTHADPGIAADLDAILLESQDWYAVGTSHNSRAVVLATSAWVEAQDPGKLYLGDVNETEAVTTVVGNGDTLDTIRTLARGRTAGIYHPSPAAFIAAAWLGKMLPTDPGFGTWKWSELAGSAPWNKSTSTQRTNLRARKANTLQTIAGKNVMWEGTVGDGDFIDVTRNIDWAEDDVQKGVFGVISQPGGLPFDQNGIDAVEAELRAHTKRGQDQGVYATDPKPQFVTPRIAGVSAPDKKLRFLRGMKFSAALRGAIHKVSVTGTLST